MSTLALPEMLDAEAALAFAAFLPQHATDPHVVRISVSAVVWRDADRRELLLMRRSDNAHWGLPGGYPP